MNPAQITMDLIAGTMSQAVKPHGSRSATPKPHAACQKLIGGGPQLKLRRKANIQVLSNAVIISG